MAFIINPSRFEVGSGGYVTVSVAVAKSYAIVKTDSLYVAVAKSYAIVKTDSLHVAVAKSYAIVKVTP